MKTALCHRAAGRGSDGTGIGSRLLPGLIDEQFSGAGWPLKRCLIQAIAFVRQCCGAGWSSKRCLIQSIAFGTQSIRLEMWLCSSYCSYQTVVPSAQ
jgi:hypothetical protein